MLNLIATLTAGSAIFLAFLVVAIRQDANVAANRWLGVFLGLLGLFMLDDSLLVYGIYGQYPELLGYLNLPLFALAPPLYLTVAQFVTPGRRFHWRHVWHFVPFGLFALLSLPFLLATDDVKRQELELIQARAPLGVAEVIVLGLVLVQMAVYLFLSFRLLTRHRRNLDSITASPDEVSLNWLWYLLWGVAAMALVWFLEIFLVSTRLVEASWYALFYWLAIYALGYFALNQREVFPFSDSDTQAIGHLLEEDGPQTGRYAELTPEREIWKKQLLALMETDKPYLDPELNLPALARMMRLSVHETSDLINSGFGENFAQFINRYRVEACKVLLLSEKHRHLSMVGIAFEAGFNSKTAFNTAFKKQVGVSPTAFREGATS